MNGWWREDATQNNESGGEKQDKVEARDLKNQTIFGEMSESKDDGSMGKVGQIGG